MTREEALNRIGELVVYARTQGWDDEFTEAFETLSMEPCKDCISRIEWLNKITVKDGMTFENGINQLLNMSSVASKVEECEDVISRKAVLDYIYNDLGLGDEENGNDVERQMELAIHYRYVKSLPPVTPQKMGRWITQWNIAHQKEYYFCSECREEFSYDGETGIKMNDYTFCPNCGAKMREGESV